LENRVLNLTETRKAAVFGGNLSQINQIDDDIENTKCSINELKKVLGISTD